MPGRKLKFPAKFFANKAMSFVGRNNNATVADVINRVEEDGVSLKYLQVRFVFDLLCCVIRIQLLSFKAVIFNFIVFDCFSFTSL